MPPLGFKLPQVAAARRRRRNIGQTVSVLPIWSAALNDVRAGVRNARVLFLGDSTTMGYGANSATFTANDRAAAFPTQLCAILSARSGLYASWSSLIGNGNVSDTRGYDSRVTFGSGQGWNFPTEFGTGAQTAGGYVTRQNAGSGNKYNFAPLNSCDTFEFYYLQTNTTGAWTPSVNDVDKAALNISFATNNPGNYAKATITHALGANVFNVRGQTGTTNPHYFGGMIAYNSAVKEITVLNAGWSGAKASDWDNGTTYAYRPLAAIAAYGPDLCVINLGINDVRAAVNEATFKSHMQAIITAAKTAGADVILMVPNPIGDGNQGALNTLATWVQALAATNGGLPVIDLRTSFVDYATANAAGRMRDQLHPNAAGYGVVATAVANVIYPV